MRRGEVKESEVQCGWYKRAVLYDRECSGEGEGARSSGGRLDCQSNRGMYGD